MFEGSILAFNYLYLMYTTAGECANMIIGEIPLWVVSSPNISLSSNYYSQNSTFGSTNYVQYYSTGHVPA